MLYDAATGKLRRAVNGPTGPLNAVRFTPDGKSLVAAGGRAGMFGLVYRFDLATGAKREARGHADAVLAADVSPDGKTLATAGYDRLVLLWDLDTLEPARTLKDHTDAVYALAFSPDGKRLASAQADRTVKLWDVASGRRAGHPFGLDGRAVRGGLLARRLDTLRRRGRSLDPRLAGRREGGALVNSAFAPRRRRCSGWSCRPTARRWPPAAKTTTSSSGTSPPSRRAALARATRLAPGRRARPRGQALAVGRYDGSVAVYDADTGKPSLSFSTAPAPAPAAAAAAKPELVRNATLNPPSPRGGVRGATVRLTLTGNGVGRATDVVLNEPGLAATIVPAAKPEARTGSSVDVTVSNEARVGLHRLGVVTPLGVPGFPGVRRGASPRR